MASKPSTDIEAAGAPAIEYAPTIADAAHEQPDRLDEKLGVDELAPSERPIDYQKMEEQQIGVTRIETLWRHFGTNRPILTSLGLTIFLVCCAFTLESSTTSMYAPLAASYFKDHARLLGIIGTVESIVNAVSKPFISKIADFTSRQTAYMVVLTFYIVGLIIVAASPTGEAYAAGRVIAKVGQAGLDLVTDIIVADLTPLEWRGFFTALTSAPFIWFAWCGPEIGDAILSTQSDGSGWRWGFGMFTILVPALVFPAACLLYWADRKARRAGEMRVAESLFERRWRAEHGDAKQPNKWDAFKWWCSEMDVVGLFLLGWAWALLLLPFNLAPAAQGRWNNPSMIAMLAVGGALFPVFFYWEWKVAKSPMLTKALLKNRTFLLAVTIDFFYFMAGNMRSLYWGSYVYVISGFSRANWGRYQNAETVGLCVFGITIGYLLKLTHRYKGIQITGLCIRIIGMGLVVYTTTSTEISVVAFAFIPVLIALGGACSVVGTRVASQGSVPHQGLGQVIAQLSLWTRLGGAVGSAIASTTWQMNMQPNMRRAGLPAADIPGLFGSIQTARVKYVWGSENHNRVLQAYVDTVRPLFIAGLCVTVIPLVCGILMPNYYLGESHNVVERTDVAGRTIVGGGAITHKERQDLLDSRNQVVGKDRSIWARVKENFW